MHRYAALEVSESLPLQHPFSSPWATYEYVLGLIVAVRPELHVDPINFWIGRVVDAHRNSQDVVSDIYVHFYQFYSGPDQYDGKFRPLVLQKGRTWLPSLDRITVHSVIFSFEKLTSKSTLSCSVPIQSRDRISLSLNVKWYYVDEHLFFYFNDLTHHCLLFFKIIY